MRTIILCISLLVALLPTAVEAQSVGAYSTESLEAQADWVSKDDKTAPYFRFVKVTKDTEPAGAAFTMAEVGRVRCTSSDQRDSFMYSCDVRGRLIFIRADAFQFDAALRSARVNFKAFGRTNLVQWSARGEAPQREWALHGGERAIVVSAGLRTRAKVRGRVMGRSFSTAGNDAHASLRRATEAGVIYETSDRRLIVEEPTRGAAWSVLRRAVSKL